MIFVQIVSWLVFLYLLLDRMTYRGQPKQGPIDKFIDNTFLLMMMT
jgi:hypothetical protein